MEIQSFEEFVADHGGPPLDGVADHSELMNLWLATCRDALTERRVDTYQTCQIAIPTGLISKL